MDVWFLHMQGAHNTNLLDRRPVKPYEKRPEQWEQAASKQNQSFHTINLTWLELWDARWLNAGCCMGG